MTSRSGTSPRTGLRAFAIAAIGFLVAATPTGRPAAQTATPAPAPPAPAASASPAPAAPRPSGPKRNIGGPGDYALREKLMHVISRDPDLMKQPIQLVLVNGGAVFSGEIRSCALEKRVLSFAATTRGIINVTDEMSVPRGDAPDAELAKAVTSILSDAAADLELKDLDVKVTDGVLTLDGVVKGMPARSRAEDLAGTVLGVTRISNHLRPADAPSAQGDEPLLRALLQYLGDFHAFAQPADITVKVDHGVATLKGKAAMFMGRQQAAVVASFVGGVVRVENRIKVDPSVPPGTRRVQAEK